MEAEQIIQKLKEVHAEIGALKTLGPRARDSSEFQIMQEKALKWLEFGGRSASRQHERFKSLSFGNPWMLGPKYYADPTLVREYAIACDVAQALLDSAIENLKLLETSNVSDMEIPPGARGAEAHRSENCVFIGHGHLSVWKDLRDFLKDRLKLAHEEFNREPTAGISHVDRLNTILGRVNFAFIILTGEDEDAAGALHARENVVHEAGLFQGKLGFTKAIILLEEGCAQFSNIEGLGQIRFPKGNITRESEEIRRVLEREKLLDPQK